MEFSYIAPRSYLIVHVVNYIEFSYTWDTTIASMVDVYIEIYSVPLNGLIALLSKHVFIMLL